MSEGTGVSTNRSDIWQPLLQEDWEYADTAVADHGSKNVQEGDEEFLVKEYLNPTCRTIPRSVASGNDVGLVCLFDNIDPAFDGEYFLLEDASGLVFNTDLTIRNIPGQFTITYSFGQPLGIFLMTIIKKVGNNFFFRWDDVEFENVDLPATFTYTPDPEVSAWGGAVHIDWLYTTPSQTVSRKVSSLPWQTFNAFDYYKFDILARPISEKWHRTVSYDFSHWVCTKTHTHNPADPGPTTPFFGSIYWKRIRNTIPVG